MARQLIDFTNDLDSRSPFTVWLFFFVAMRI
jgi:hypothetical protein